MNEGYFASADVSQYRHIGVSKALYLNFLLPDLLFAIRCTTVPKTHPRTIAGSSFFDNSDTNIGPGMNFGRWNSA